jgi:FMN phosphatase YigB (HAD superfamily)
MSHPLVTVDFHNTLIECEEWFQLEVRTLASSVVDWAVQQAAIQNVSVDRTVIDAEYRKLRLAIHLHGHELEAERSVVTVLDRIGIALERETIASAVRELMLTALHHAKSVPGALLFLQELHAQGVRLAIVSSAVYHPFLEWALAEHAMRDLLDVVVTSASCGFYKSRPEIYWAALDAIGAPANESVHIGDSLRFDVGGASMAGMKTAWYDRQRSNGREALGIVPDLVVTDLGSAWRDMLVLTRTAVGGIGSRPGIGAAR